MRIGVESTRNVWEFFIHHSHTLRGPRFVELAMSPVFPDDNPVVRGCLQRPRRGLSGPVVKVPFFAGSYNKSKLGELRIADLHFT